MAWIYKIVLALAGFSQVGFAKITPLSPKLAEKSADDPAASHVVFDSNISHPLNAAEENQGPRVRIGLRLTPFVKIVNRQVDGRRTTRFIPAEPLRHTLRARMNAMNHFFVSDWHIETKPLKWIKQAGRYDMRLTFYRRYGAFGQLEEHIGSVDVSGTLDTEKDQVYVLIGVARRRLRDKMGSPYLDVVAGFAPGPTKPALDLSKVDRSPPKGPAEPPANYSGSLIRGRF
jgi:hypothetical protein